MQFTLYLTLSMTDAFLFFGKHKTRFASSRPSSSSCSPPDLERDAKLVIHHGDGGRRATPLAAQEASY